MKPKITAPIPLPDPIPTAVVMGDDPFYDVLEAVANVVLLVVCSAFITVWAAIWFRIYAWALRLFL